MAPMAFIMGGVFGTFSALFSWLLFGLGFWAAVQVYFIVGLCVAALLIAAALLRPKATSKPASSVKTSTLQQA